MKQFLLGLLATFILTSCSVNILQEFSDVNSNEALFFDAKQLVNAGNYAGAIAKFNAMSATYLAKRDVKVVHASAYLGLCTSLDFLDLVDALSSMATRVVPWLMSTFQGGDASRQASCIQAETIIKSISDLGVDRTADENLLMAFISFAKMGALVSRYGDSGTPDGSVDAGFDPCDVGDFPAVASQEFATGLIIAMDALENIGSSTIGAGATGDFTAACAALPPLLNFCADPPQTDIADIDANEQRGIRTLINESQDVGLGTCTGDAVACACP
ncbi:MAG: hypothetical protein AB7N80_05625 [Bdellovibrionales bacterium]